jgi:hypothetical protein
MRDPRWLLTLGVAAAALILDPLGACGDGGYQFGTAELRAVVAGEWHVEAAGRTYDLTIDAATAASAAHGPHASAGWVHASAACGERALVREAGACVDLTTMPVFVTGRNGEHFTGELTAVGLEFHHADLRVLDGDKEVFSARVEADGRATSEDKDVVVVHRPAGANARS